MKKDLVSIIVPVYNTGKYIRECLDNPCLILFGNKIDIDKKEWQVTKEEVEKFAGSLNLTYFETSAKTKQGLNEGFSFIVNKAYDRVKTQSSFNLEEDEYEIVNGCFGKKKRRKKKNKDKDKDKDSDKGKVKEKNKK